MTVGSSGGNIFICNILYRIIVALGTACIWILCGELSLLLARYARPVEFSQPYIELESTFKKAQNRNYTLLHKIERTVAPNVKFLSGVHDRFLHDVNHWKPR